MRKLTLFPIFFICLSSWAQPKVSLPTDVSEVRLATEVLWSRVKALPATQRPRIILVLGGGGAKGLSHIGVVQVLEQEQIPIDEIVGVSVGALFGALYAGGISANQIGTMAEEIGWNKLTDYSKVGMMKLILSDSLFSTTKMENYLHKYIGDKNFSDLRIPYSCVATDLRTGDRVIFQEGPVAVAARASATIPGIFEPVEYRHRSLVDGGLVDNLPIDIARSHDPDAIVVGVIPSGLSELGEKSSVFKTLVRSIEIQKAVIIDEKKKLADFLIEPDVSSISIVDLSRSKECIEAGLLATRERVLDLKELIIQRTFEKKGIVLGKK